MRSSRSTRKKLAAALINATAAQLLAISMAYGDKVKDKTA